MFTQAARAFSASEGRRDGTEVASRRLSQIDAVAEGRRHQDADDRVADGFFVAQSVPFTQGAIEDNHVVAFSLRQGTTVSAFGKSLKRLEVAGLRRQTGLLDPADVGGDAPEVVFDGLDGGAIAG